MEHNVNLISYRIRPVVPLFARHPAKCDGHMARSDTYILYLSTRTRIEKEMHKYENIIGRCMVARGVWQPLGFW